MKKTIKLTETNLKDIIKNILKEEYGHINPNYTHFALNKNDNLIYNGWDFDDLDKESILYYAKGDLKDDDLNPKDFKIMNTKALLKNGIDPFDNDNWRNYEY